MSYPRDLRFIYSKPEQFYLQRFLEQKFSPLECIPFSRGNRRCLEATFAIYKIKQLLMVLFSHYSLKSVVENLQLAPKMEFV